MNFKEWLLTESLSDSLQSLLILSKQMVVPGYSFNYRDFYKAFVQVQNQFINPIRTGEITDRNILLPIETAINNNPESLPTVIQQVMTRLPQVTNTSPVSGFRDEDE